MQDFDILHLIPEFERGIIITKIISIHCDFSLKDSKYCISLPGELSESFHFSKTNSMIKIERLGTVNISVDYSIPHTDSRSKLFIDLDIQEL